MSVKYSTYHLIICFLLLFASKPLFAQSKEQVIAAYLEKFANYIEWPTTQEHNEDIFKIVVVGDMAMCETIIEAYKSRTINGKHVQVECLKKVENIPNIDMLLLVSNKIKELELALQMSAEDNFLLVTYAVGYAKRGSHINFYITEEQNLLFEMNKKSLDSSGFKVDFLLLSFARVVDN